MTAPCHATCKPGLDTFASANLDFILRSRGIDTVILGGFLNQLLPRVDCVASTSVEENDNAIRFDYPMFSHPLESTEVAAAL